MPGRSILSLFSLQNSRLDFHPRIAPIAVACLTNSVSRLATAGCLLFTVLTLLIPTGCSISPSVVDKRDGAPRGPVDIDNTPDATPRVEPLSRYGNPASYVVFGKRYHTLATSLDYREQGVASWYGTKFHGQRTSSGEPYDMYAMTAAHKTLPLPTYARVTNLENGRSIVVKINDRGPFHANRIIDLSYVAAAKLGILGNGTGLVEVLALNPGRSPRELPSPRVAESHKDLYIQVGAFDNPTNAQRLREKLRTALSHSVRIQEIGTEEQTLFRVQVGPIGTLGTANALTTRLARMGIPNTHLVIE